MAKLLRRLVRLVPLGLLLVAGSALAQNNSSITGVVTDASTGKPVVGAVVVVTSPALQAEQTVVTEAGGVFTVPGLPPGDYTMSVQMDGYKPFERSDLKLKEAVTLRANAAVVPEAVQMEEVVVTGSRIKRKDLTTPAPVTVISHEQLAESGKVTIGEFLQALPEQAGGANAQVNNGGDGSQTVDLRGIQANRTLVLINGRRTIASGNAQSTYNTYDLNSIPTAAIERVEILKDGGSSVYGSDAIGGVVNIITRKKLDGAEVSFQYGDSSHNDGTLKQVDVVAGAVSEKGSILVAGGYSEQAPVWARDRGHMGTIYSYDYGTKTASARGSPGSPAGFYFLDAPCDANNPACQQLINVDPNYLNSGNSFVPPTGSPTIQTPADYYNYQQQNYLFTPLRRWQLWASGEMKLGDVATGYFEGSFVNRYSKQTLAPEPLYTFNLGANGIPISPDSIYNPYGVPVDAGRRLTEFGNRIFTQDDNTYRFVGGVRGELGDWAGPVKGWAWDTSIVYASNNSTYDNKGSLRSTKIGDAIGPSMIDPATGQPICVRNPGDPSTKIDGCVPLNILGGPNTITPDMVAGLTFDGTDRANWNMASFEANVSGDLFRLAAQQPVGLAAGYEFRREWGYALPNPISGAGESSGNNFLGTTPGGYEVASFYGELSVPLLSNKPLAELLEVTGSFRWSNYSNFGKNTTYKLGGRWSPVRDVTLRGTYSTAFRAPSVVELFSGQADNFEQSTDPCAHIDPNGANAATLTQNCGAAANNGYAQNQVRAKSGGNPNLQPEEAKIWTAGLVYEPRQVEGLSFTVDYYLIDIDKTISTIGADVILNGCYLQGNQSYCNLITRSPINGYITSLQDTNLNVGKLSTAGIDLAARYDTRNSPFGRFGLAFAGSVLQKYDVTNPDGTVWHYKGNADGIGPNLSQGGAPFKAVASVVWAAPEGAKGLGAGIDTRFVAPYKECGTADGSSEGGLCNSPGAHPERTVNAYNQWNGFVSYQLLSKAGKTTLMLGLQNIFDTKPPIIYRETFTNSDASVYDYMGRFWYVRLAHAL